MNSSFKQHFASNLTRTAFVVALLALFLGGTLRTHAGSHTWNGSVNGLWSNPANWQSGGAPAPGEADVDLFFPANANTYQVSNNIAGLTVRTMGFSANYIIRGLGVTLAPVNSGWNLHVSVASREAALWLPLTLPAGEFSVRAASSSMVRLYGAISGPGSLRKDDVGDLVIAGDSGNSFTGGFHQHGGTTYLFKQSGVALPGPVVVGVSNSNAEATLEYSAHHQIADTADVYLHGYEAWLDLDGFNDTIDSLTLVESSVTTGGFSTVGQLRLNGDLTARQRSTSGNWVPKIFGRLNLGNVAHNFHIATNSGLNLHADVESTGTNGGFNVRGGGYIYLDGSNSFTGPLRLVEGSVSVRDSNALGSPVGATILEGGEMSVVRTGHNFTEPLIVKTNAGLDFYGTNGWNGPIQIQAGATLTLYGPSFDTPDVLTLGGVISGAGNVHISSIEVDIVGSSGNTFSGRTEIRGASVVRMNKTSGHALSGSAIFMEGSAPPQLRWKRDNQVPDNTRIEYNGSSSLSGDLYLENHSDTIGSLDNGWNALISCGTGILTIGADNLDGDFFGSITGSGSTNIIKTGTGSFTLRGNHALAGKMVVNGGALILNNASGVGPVHVANNARLAGQGNLGALTVGPTASISPGTSLGGSSYGALRPGTFNLGGGYLGMQLGGVNPGSSHDQIVVAGPVNINGVLLQLSALNLPHGSNSFTIVDVTSGALTGEFLGLPEGEVFPSSDGKSFRITYHGGTGNDVVVTRHYTGPIGGQISGVTPLPDGRMQINGTGLPAVLYQVQATTNFAPGSWVNLGLTEADAETSVIQFIDPGATNFPHRFYRFLAQ